MNSNVEFCFSRVVAAGNGKESFDNGNKLFFGERLEFGGKCYVIFYVVDVVGFVLRGIIVDDVT
jgi:hypothetical protein